MQGADVAVVGAGVVGAVAAWRLASLGATVALLDRGGVASGASGVNAGMIDAAGWGDGTPPDLETTLKMGSWELYQRAQLDEGEPIGLRRSGSLAFIATPAEHALAEASVAAARAAGHHVELLTTAELRSLEPEASPALLGARWSPLAAQADPADATRAFARLAARAGARVLEGHAVTALRRGRGGFTLSSSRGELHCGTLVLAAGAWLGPLARQLGADIEPGVVPVRGQMWATPPLPPRVFATFSAVESPLAWSAPGAPPTVPPQLTHAGTARLTRHLYGRQARSGEVVVGGDRQLVAGDGPPRPDPAGIDVNRAQAAAVLPFLGGVPVARTWAGLMPFSRDGRPVLGQVAEDVFVAGGLGSSGFNRGPMAGWLVADLASGRAVPACVAEADPPRSGPAPVGGDGPTEG